MIEGVPDNYRYRDVTFYPDTLQFFLSALRHYASRLESDLQVLEDGSELSGLLTDEAVKTFPVFRTLRQVKHLIDKIQRAVDHDPNAPDYEVDILHAEARLMRSVAEHYLSYLRGKASELAGKGSTSVMFLDAIDTRITEFQEKTVMGIFQRVEPVPLVVEDVPAESSSDEQLAYTEKLHRPMRIIRSIEIVDTQLRERCMDLLDAFQAGNEPHRFDTVISEATRILEDRIRRRAGLENTLVGVELVKGALAGDDPPLRLSSHQGEQEAAHLLFRGVFGFIRNPFHHRLVDEVQPERVIQILGIIDYLLFLTDSATTIENRHTDDD